MAWHWTGDKPLPEPMLKQLTDDIVSLGRSELKNGVTSLLLIFQSSIRSLYICLLLFFCGDKFAWMHIYK